MPSCGRILLVDDEPLVLEMFQDVFTQKGYDVVVAGSANDALNHLERSGFDVTVCDVMMEGLDGFDLLSIARKKNPTIGVVLITGAPSIIDCKRAETLKAHYLSKPVGIEHLVGIVKDSVQSSRTQFDRRNLN